MILPTNVVESNDVIVGDIEGFFEMYESRKLEDAYIAQIIKAKKNFDSEMKLINSSIDQLMHM